MTDRGGRRGAAQRGGEQSDDEGEEGDYNDQFGLINFADDSDLLSNLNLCELELNVIAIPILSNNDESVCINTDNDDNDGNAPDSGHDN